MVARTGMSNLLSALRGMTNAGTADFTIGTTAYWSDDQLQTICDRYATPIRDEHLKAISSMNTGGAISYFDYQSNSRYYEATTGGTAVFIIRDTTGAIIPSTNWSADYERGAIAFTADTLGVPYYLTGRSYDLNAAAADIWYQKAAHASEMIDFDTDNHKIKRSHIVAAMMKMAQKYEAMATFSSSPVEMVRGDLR